MQGGALWKGAYERHVLELLLRLIEPGDVVFDVGANMGQHSCVLARRGAEVFAFEPLPRLYDRLRENVRLNGLEQRVRAFPWALADRCGAATLYEAERADDGTHSLLPGVAADRISPTTVALVTLHEVVAVTGRRPEVIKIDVEGYEGYVLAGGEALLRSEHPPVIVFETGHELADAEQSARSVIRRLVAGGYGVFHVPRDGGPLTRVTTTAPGDRIEDYCAISEASGRIRNIS